MAIEIYSSREYGVKLKATVHQTGKLGFTEETAKKLNLDGDKGIKFAADKENDLYLIIILNEKDEDSFKVMKAGGYYSVNARGVFDAWNLDYVNKTIIFDMTDASEQYKDLGNQVFILKEREKLRKKG